MIDITLLKTICEIPGAPGFEQRIRSFVLKEIEPYVDSLEVDPMGNIIAVKKGKEDKKVMVAAHLDEISFIVTHIDEEGFVRFHTLGGFDPQNAHSTTRYPTWQKRPHRSDGMQADTPYATGRARQTAQNTGLFY